MQSQRGPSSIDAIVTAKLARFLLCRRLLYQVANARLLKSSYRPEVHARHPFSLRECLFVAASHDLSIALTVIQYLNRWFTLHASSIVAL
jgi:hypothetical protein